MRTRIALKRYFANNPKRYSKNNPVPRVLSLQLD